MNRTSFEVIAGAENDLYVVKNWLVQMSVDDTLKQPNETICSTIHKDVAEKIFNLLRVQGQPPVPDYDKYPDYWTLARGIENRLAQRVGTCKFTGHVAMVWFFPSSVGDIYCGCTCHDSVRGAAKFLIDSYQPEFLMKEIGL